jgi:hypothetical protein
MTNTPPQSDYQGMNNVPVSWEDSQPDVLGVKGGCRLLGRILGDDAAQRPPTAPPARLSLTFKQATSYWETETGFLEFWGCSPA